MLAGAELLDREVAGASGRGLALALLALAAGAHGAAHGAKCQDGTKIKDPTVGKCPAMASGDFTPSYCKVQAAGQNATITTAAAADLMFKGFKDSMDEQAKDSKKYYETLCGTGKVKADAAIDWHCGVFKFTVTSYMCNKDTTCPLATPLPACETWTTLMTAVCDLTAAEIKGAIASAKTNSGCKDKADGGIEFTAEGAAAPATTPAPAAASGSSPMWALALAACLFAGVPAVSRSV